MRIETDPGSPSELPAGWVEQHDAVSGRIYWLHLHTSRVAYRRPRRSLPPEPLPEESGSVSLGSTSPETSRSADDNAARITRPRTRPTSMSPRPGILQTIDSTSIHSMQTRVNDSSSGSSTGSTSLRSPPPPYDATPVPDENFTPPLIPLPPMPSRQPRPRSLGAGGSNGLASPLPGSRTFSPTSIVPDLEDQSTPIVTQTSSPSTTRPSRMLPMFPPLLAPRPQNASAPSFNLALAPPAPIMSSNTTPSSSQLGTPRSARSSHRRPPALPPVPPELRDEIRRNRSGRSASTQANPSTSSPAVNLPARSNSEPVGSFSGVSTASGDSVAGGAPFLAVPRSPRSGISRINAENLFQHHLEPSNRRSPSSRSDRSNASEATVTFEPNSDDYQRNASSHATPSRSFDNGASNALRPASTLPIERARRPYTVAVPSIMSSPGWQTLRTQLDPGGRRTRTAAERSPSFPLPRNGRSTGLTPDMEELSNFSTSPRSRSPFVDTPQRAGYPSTPFARPRSRSEDAYPERRDFHPEPDSNDDIAEAIRNSMPTPRRGASSPYPRGGNRPEPINLATQAEQYASDLESHLSSSSSRSQRLLNELWRVKLEKAQRKIDELQEKLVDLGRRDFQLERELQREKAELNDWDIARLDEGIMRDLGMMTEAEYARLKRELDREMTIDELRERLSFHEPLQYEYDPFDPEGQYLPFDQDPLDRVHSNGYRADSPAPGTYFSDCDCHSVPTSRPLNYPYRPSSPHPFHTRHGHPGQCCPLPSVKTHRNVHHSCSCIDLHGQAICRKAYTHRHEAQMSTQYRGIDPGHTRHNGGYAHAFVDDYDTSGYSSADDQMFSTPRMSSSGPFSRSRSNSTSALQPRPILRRTNSHGVTGGKHRGRRVSFEDELDLGDEGVSMFRTTPDHTQFGYRFP